MSKITKRQLPLTFISALLMAVISVSSCSNQEAEVPSSKIEDLNRRIPLVAGFDFNQQMDSLYTQNIVFKQTNFGGKQYDVRYTPQCFKSGKCENCYSLYSVVESYGQLDSKGYFIEGEISLWELIDEFSGRFDFQQDTSEVMTLWTDYIQSQEKWLGLSIYEGWISRDEIYKSLKEIENSRSSYFFLSKDSTVLYKFFPTFKEPINLDSVEIANGEYFAYEKWLEETKLSRKFFNNFINVVAPKDNN